MNELNYHHLRYFQAVALEGNLTRAAETLGVSQSAVSTQIRLLEERLGHALFERRGRSLLLTEAGRIALDYSNSIFASGEELLATLQAGGQQRKALRVGSLATLSRNFQLKFLKPLLSRNDVEIILRSGSASELYNALSGQQLDIVLTNQPPSADALTSFVVQEIDRQEVSLIGTPDLATQGASLKDWFAQKPVVLPLPGSALRLEFDSFVSRLGVHPQIAAEVDDMAMMRLLVREGVGFAPLPPIVVRDELARGELVEVAKLTGITETFYGVTVQRRFPNPILNDLLT